MIDRINAHRMDAKNSQASHILAVCCDISGKYTTSTADLGNSLIVITQIVSGIAGKGSRDRRI
jgi:hypothetical protein